MTKKGKKNIRTQNEVELLYAQLDDILNKTRITKMHLAKGISMSYQGFLQSYRKRNLTLDKWVTISRFLNLPLTVQLETEKRNIDSPNKTLEPVQRAQRTDAEIANFQSRIGLFEQHIAQLESRIEDKELIISLLRR